MTLPTYATTYATRMCQTVVRDSNTCAQGLTYGVLTGAYTTTRFLKAPKPSKLESVALLGHEGAATDAAVARGTALARGNLYTRYLVEAPPNVCTPTYLANSAVAIAEKFPETMTCRILERAECEEMGMGCYLGVAEVRDVSAPWCLRPVLLVSPEKTRSVFPARKRIIKIKIWEP